MGAALQTVSMTGYGMARRSEAGVSIEVEIRTVNSRYLDCVFRLPRGYGSFENPIREQIARQISRGRIEINITREILDPEISGAHYQEALFQAYLDVYKKVAEKHGVWDGKFQAKSILELLSRREVLDLSEEAGDTSKELSVVLSTVDQALNSVSGMRSQEGAKIARDLESRIEKLRSARKEILGFAADAAAQTKVKLEERVSKLIADHQLDPARLATEIALLADKADITEELLRLESHIEQFMRIMGEPPNGRKLDFMLQEFGREFNTISSKASHARVQAIVVDAKAEVEKMKEQVQNVE